MSLQEVSEDYGPTREETEHYRPPFPLYTAVLTGAIALVFVAQLGTGFEASVDVTSFDKEKFRAGEFWRIMTGMTVHGGPLHVLMNGYALYSFGRICEMLTSRAHLAIVFVLAGLGGGLLSLIFLPGGRSVGATGAILGLVGYLVVYAFRRRRFISPEFRKNLLINIGFIMIFGLVLFEQIDNFAHLGGLLAGAIYAFVQIPTDEYVDPRVASKGAEIGGLAFLGLFLGACTFSVVLMLGIA